MNAHFPRGQPLLFNLFLVKGLWGFRSLSVGLAAKERAEVGVDSAEGAIAED